MPRRKIACNRCGRFREPGVRSLEPGLYRCHACRREAKAGYGQRASDFRYRFVCEGCGVEFGYHHAGRRFCSIPCANRSRVPVFRPAGHPQVKRRALEASAPGLSVKARRALLARWIVQGRVCVYCRVRPGITLDHVVPLCAGGTNYEGNLAPSCRSCNSSKSGSLLIQWKFGRRALV